MKALLALLLLLSSTIAIADLNDRYIKNPNPGGKIRFEVNNVEVLTIEPTGGFTLPTGSIVLDGATSGSVTLAAPATVTSYTLTLPDSDGDNLQFLRTDGSGTTEWANAVGNISDDPSPFLTANFNLNGFDVFTPDNSDNDTVDTLSMVFATGDKTVGTADSGDIIFQTGAATDVQGKIKLVDGSEGNIGDVWTSSAVDGSGGWATPPSSSLQAAFDAGQSITIADTDNQTLSLTNNDVTNNPVTMSIVNNATNRAMNIVTTFPAATATTGVRILQNNNTTSGNNYVLQVQQTSISTDAPVFAVENKGSGSSVWIRKLAGDSASNALEIDVDDTASPGMDIRTNSASNGADTIFIRNSSSVATSDAMIIEKTGTGGDALRIRRASDDENWLTLQASDNQEIDIRMADAATQTASWVWYLPPDNGNPNEFLQTDGSGNSVWAAASSDLQTAFDGGQTIVIADTDNQTLSITNNDVTNNPDALSITNTTSGENIFATSSDGIAFYGQNTGTANRSAYFRNTNASNANPVLGLRHVNTTGAVLELSRADSANSVNVKIDPASSTWNWTLPPNDGNTGEVLVTNGSGVTTWGNATVTLQQAANAGSTVSVGTELNWTKASGSGNAVTFTNNGAGDVLELNTGAAGEALEINDGTNGHSIDLNKTAGTGDALNINNDGTGYGLWLENSASSLTGLFVRQDASFSATTIDQNGDSWGLLVDHDGTSGVGIEVNMTGVGDYLVLSGSSTGRDLTTPNSAVVDANPTNSMTITTGNKTGVASTGKSGDLLLQTGTSVDGDSGDISILPGTPSGTGAMGDVIIDGNNLDINTWIDVTDNSNFNLIDVNKTGGNGDAININNGGNASAISINNSGADSLLITTTSGGDNSLDINHSSGSFPAIDLANTTTSQDAIVISGTSTGDSITTPDNATVDANPTQSLSITTGNKTGVASTGESGEITFQTGTAVDGNTGEITISTGTPTGTGLQGNMNISGRNILTTGRIDLTYPDSGAEALEVNALNGGVGLEVNTTTGRAVNITTTSGQGVLIDTGSSGTGLQVDGDSTGARLVLVGRVGSNAVGINVPQSSSITGHTLVLPGALGSAGAVLTDAAGDGILSWTTPSSGIANVVEDTTPQLGGDLDLNTFKVTEGATSVLHLTTSTGVSLGQGAGNLTLTGIDNTLLGARAGDNLAAGLGNTFVGLDAGGNATSANNSVYIGRRAGELANATDSLAIGVDALRVATGGSNLGIGKNAGIKTTTGTFNVYVGTLAGEDAVVQSHNTCVGHGACLNNNSNNGRNTIIGSSAGGVILGGTENTIIGFDAEVSTGALSNSIAIGSEAVVDASNKARIGDDTLDTLEFTGLTTADNFTIQLSDDSVADADPASALTIQASNKTAGTGVGGDLLLTSGTGFGGGARGKIYLVDASIGITGECWVSTGTAGEGNWDTCPGSSLQAAANGGTTVSIGTELNWTKASGTGNAVTFTNNGVGDVLELNTGASGEALEINDGTNGDSVDINKTAGSGDALDIFAAIGASNGINLNYQAANSAINITSNSSSQHAISMFHSGTDVPFEVANNSASDSNYISILGSSAGDSIATPDDATVDAIATHSLSIVTGDKSGVGSTGKSGDITLETGATDDGDSGSIFFTTGTPVDAGTQGDIILDGNTVQFNASVLDVNTRIDLDNSSGTSIDINNTGGGFGLAMNVVSQGKAAIFQGAHASNPMVEVIGTGSAPVGVKVDVNAGPFMNVVAETSGDIDFRIPATVTSYDFTFPNNDGDAGQFLQTDGSGVTTWVTPSGGIANVVEDASPQLGGNLDILSRKIFTSTTDQDVIVEPNGTGAFRLSPSGNARGDNAVDLQMVRTNVTEVASGADSVIIGGVDNTASGTRSVVLGGTDNTASSQDAVAFGNNSTASGTPSFAGGGSGTTATGNYSFAYGLSSNAGATSAIALGRDADVTNTRGIAIGSFVRASGDTSRVMGSEMTVSGTGSFGIGLGNFGAGSYTGNGTLSQSDTMAIMGGQVGVGVLNPDRTFEVNGTSEVTNSTDAIGFHLVQSHASTINAAIHVEMTGAGGAVGHRIDQDGTNSGIRVNMDNGSNTVGGVHINQESASGFQLALQSPQGNGFSQGTVRIKIPDGTYTMVDLTLPSDDGDAGEFLQTDGSGALTWEPASVPTSVPKWTKYTLDTTDINDADLQQDVTVIAMAANTTIEGVIIKHSTAFSGTACTALTVEVGISGTSSKYASAFDIFQTVSNTAKQSSASLDVEVPATNLVAQFNSTGCNLSAFSAGSVDVWVKSSVLP